MARKPAQTAVIDLAGALEDAAKTEPPLSRSERAKRALAGDPAGLDLLRKKLDSGVTASALARAMKPKLPGISAKLIGELVGVPAAQKKPAVQSPAAPQQAATKAPQDDVPNIVFNLGGSEPAVPQRPVKK